MILDEGLGFIMIWLFSVFVLFVTDEQLPLLQSISVYL